MWWYRLVPPAFRGRRIKASFSCIESLRTVGYVRPCFKGRAWGWVLMALLEGTATDFRNCKVQGFP